MTTVIRRRGPIVALLAVLGLVLGACASGPSQVNAAAIVGGKSITVDQVQELVDKALKSEPAAKVLADQRKVDLLSRAVLRQLVVHELIGAYTAKRPVQVEPGQVSQLATQLRESLRPLPTDGTAAPEAIVDQAVNKAFDPELIARDYLLLAKIGGEQAAKLSVTFDYTIIAPGGADSPTGSLREAAAAKAREFAQGLEQADKGIEAEIQAGAQASKNETVTPALASDIAGSLLFGSPVNSVVAFQPSKENAGWVVAVIRKRDTDAPPAADAPAADPRVATTLGPRLLQSTVDEVGVKISPRYGVWDVAAMAVAPSEAETAGLVLPVKNAPAAP